jgi:CRP/FNR family cyclic AMP-dependent transcriptional regulator
MIVVRQAEERDAPAIREIFLATYGEDYTYPQFYDEQALKRMIFNDETLILVAEDSDTDQVLGTASVILEIGAYSDLVGEFGRLAVHPEARHQGIGRMLVTERLERVRGRLHVALMEARVTHQFTQRIALKQGFAPVGFVPLKWPFGDRRESFAIMLQYFRKALAIRRNHPRVVPEVSRLAEMAMRNIGIDCDVIIDEDSAPYPHVHDFRLEELSTEGYWGLLRIRRGRVQNREVFGPLRLNYGFFRLQAKHSNYLLAYEDQHLAGALGFMIERYEDNVRVFELIPVEDRSIQFLLSELERRCREEWGIKYIEIDVKADSPRIQRTLVELGFVPTAYLPAFAFTEVERLDVVRMTRLLAPFELGEIDLISPSLEVGEVVIHAFTERQVVPRIAEVAPQVGLFTGLSDEQTLRLAGTCGYARFDPGETIFREGDHGEDMFVILTGEVCVRLDSRDVELGSVGVGECLGEVALLTDSAHSATASACGEVEAAVIPRRRLIDLVRRRPDIGVVLYRNVAVGLGDKLRRADITQAAGQDGLHSTDV